MRINNTNIIKNTFKNFIVNYKSMILFEMLYKLLVICIFIPTTEFIIGTALFNLGEFTITNTEIAKYILSIPMIIAIICILIISFVAIFIEVSTIIYIANESRQNRKVSYRKGIINSIKILKRAVSIYIIPVVFLLGIIGPITHIGVRTSIIKNIKIPDFIIGELFKLEHGKFIFHTLTLILILIFSRWIYSIIAIVIEDINLKEAFKHSKKINKNSKGKTVYYLFLWSISSILIKIILLIVYFIFIYMLLSIVGTQSSIAEIIFYIAIILFIIGYSLISVITIPLFITFLLELYYKFKNYNVNLRKDQVREKFKFKKSIKQILNILIIVLFIISVFLMIISTLMNEYSSNTQITAHRGSSLRAPENSMAAIEYAIQEKADYVEIDVMTTKDNRVVLFHDTTLKRIANSNRKIKDMTLKEVKQIDNGSYFSEKFSDEKVPTLEEVFKEFKGKIKFNIELKPTRKGDKLAEEVAKLIKKYQMENQVIVSSLNKDTIIRFEEQNSEIDSGYIISFGFGDLSSINVDFISVEYDLLSDSLIELFHIYGKKVHVWTLNDKNRIERAMDLGVDNIITDDVLLARETAKKSRYKEFMISFLVNMEGLSYTEEEYEKYNEHIDYILSNLNYITWFEDIVKNIVMQVRI